MPRTLKPSDGCIVDRPNSQTIQLGGIFINICAIARVTEIDQSYISKILSGKRSPTVATARKIAKAIGGGFTIDSLLAAIDSRLTSNKLEGESINVKPSPKGRPPRPTPPRR